MEKQNSKVFVAGHKWSTHSVQVQTRAKISGRVTISYKELNFLKLGISPNGLLAQCIRDSSPPIDNSDAFAVLSTVQSLAATNEGFRKILSTEPSSLRLIDVSNLFEIVDSHFKSAGLPTSPASAEKFRSFILRCQAPILGNLSTSQCTYKSPLIVPRRIPRKDIIKHANEQQSTSPIKPSEAITAQEVSEFIGIAQNHYEQTLKPILQKCEKIFAINDELKDLLASVHKKQLPTNLTEKHRLSLKKRKGKVAYRVMLRQLPMDQLNIALYVIRRDKLHKFAPCGLVISPKGIPVIDRISGFGGARHRFCALLAQTYLPQQVVMECYIILLFFGRWNGDTLISVTPENVKRTAHGFEISGIKGKNDSFQNTSITVDDKSTVIEEALAVRAIELLLWHNKNVDLHGIRQHPSLFVSMNHAYSKRYEFNTFLDSKYFHKFTSSWDLPKFTASDIRPNSERHRFLQDGMHIEDTQVTLYHKRASTSTHYVAGEIASAINEAIVIRYSAMLSSAIEFRFNNTVVPEEFSEEQKRTIQSLLLPPSRFSPNTDDYLVDLWLASPGEFTFFVGYPEVDQCIRQRKYYLSNMHALRSANPERFAQSELPRILVCLALYTLIKNSDFRIYLEEQERNIDAQKS